MDLKQVKQAVLWIVYVLLPNTGCSQTEVRGHCVGFIAETLTFNCSYASLTTFPQHVPNLTKHLVLSHNAINYVSNMELGHLTMLSHLDLSHNNISHLAVNTFKGLVSLEHLDLSFNPLYYLGIPPGIFDDQSESLRVLMLTTDKTIQSGYPVANLAKLSHLRELHINGVQLTKFPEKLAQLPLKVLNMQCPGQQGGPNQLSAQWFQHLQNASVEDISFFNCKISHIQHGTFRDFKNLRALNLGKNPYGDSLSHFTKPLSVLGMTPLRTLLLDHTLKFINTELQSEQFCNDIGDRITHLSIRFNNLKNVDLSVFKCMPNLSHFSFGFNAIATYTPAAGLIKTVSFNNFLSVLFPSLLMADMSHSHANPTDYRKYFNASNILKTDNFFRDIETDIPKGWRSNERNDSYGAPSKPTILFTIPENWRALYSRNAVLGPFVGWLYGPVTFSQPNNLEVADFSFSTGKSVLFSLFGFYGLNKMKVIDVGYSSLGPPAEPFALLEGYSKPHYPNLRELRSPGNSLEGYLHHFEALFNNTPLLESLDLSNNGIQSIPPTTFNPLRKLKTLNVANNALSVNSNFTLFNLSLRCLDISGNSFAYLPEPLIQGLNSMHKTNPVNTLMVDIQRNPFVCDCSSLTFLKWVQTTDILIKNPDRLKCKVAGKSRNGSIPILQVSLEELHQKCSSLIDKEQLIAATVASAASLIIIGLVLYRLRWRLKWYYYKHRHLCLGSGLLTDVDSDGNTQYDALIIYSERGTKDLAIVKHQLKPRLEDEMGYRIFFNGRDDMPGDTKADEVIRAITLSRKALVLVTNDLVQDSLCNFAIHMLIENGEIVDRVCLIVDRAVDIGRISNKVLKGLLNPATGISQIQFDDNTWTADSHPKKILKEKLKNFLQFDSSSTCRF